MTFRFLQRTSILFAVAVLTYACSAEKNPSGGGVINIGIGGNTANSGNAGQAGGASITSTDPASSQAGSSSTSTVVIRSDASVTVSDTRSVALDDCPGSLDSATVTALDRGATVDPSMKWLYPYDNTVFPGGLLAPILQWVPQSGGTQAIMLKMRSAQFSYRGCFGPADPAQLIIPQNVWEAAYKYQAPSDSLTVELTTKSGNTISGPIKETWVFARGKLRGDVYYSTYDSIKVNGGNEAMSNGAVMRIRPDQTEPEVLLSVQGGFYPFGPCISCHSVSANGGKMIASLHTYPMIANVGLFSSASYDLQKNPDVNPPTLFDGLDEAGFGALYPDGSRYMSNGSPSDSTNSEQLFYPYVPDNIYAMLGPRMSKLYDTATGQPIAAAGWDGVINYAKMPMFSTDGKKIVFNHHEDSGGHSLAVMDFDATTNTFSNLEIIYKHDSLYPGWPFFTPDSNYVIFALGNDSHFASCELGLIGDTVAVYKSDLYILDLNNNNNVIPLKMAGGFKGDTSYLPQGDRDAHFDFYPTVAPISSGGYFWLYFTSRRTYGNISSDMDVLDRKTKKIWISAINIPGAGEFGGLNDDPSHPAFVLPGQEMRAGNMRAFPTLEPCKEDGQPCEVGLDCCHGFCTNGKCGPPEKGCSQLEEACETSADCCDPTHECIGGFCSIIILK